MPSDRECTYNPVGIVTHGSVCRYIISFSETYSGALILVAFPGQQNTPMGTWLNSHSHLSTALESIV